MQRPSVKETLMFSIIRDLLHNEKCQQINQNKVLITPLIYTQLEMNWFGND